MRKLLRVVDARWFAPAPAARPALLRIAIGAYAFWYVWNRREMLNDIVVKGDPNHYQPVGLARVHRKPLPPALVRGLVIATLVANVAFVAGWRHRFTGPLYSGLFLWLLSYRNSWSMIFHSDNVLVFHLLILGHTKSADALSLDAWRGGPAAARSASVDWRYGWPIQLMNAVTAVAYFLAGIAKLKGPSGLEWASGEQLRRQIAVDALRKEVLGKPASLTTHVLYRQDGLFRALAVGSLIVEVVAPLVLADRRLARVWAVNAWVMHWGILALMKITFRYQLSGVMYLSFFEIERLLEAAVRQANRQRLA